MVFSNPNFVHQLNIKWEDRQANSRESVRTSIRRIDVLGISKNRLTLVFFLNPFFSVTNGMQNGKSGPNGKCVRTFHRGIKVFEIEQKWICFLVLKIQFWFTNCTLKWIVCHVNPIGTALLFPSGDKACHALSLYCIHKN